MNVVMQKLRNLNREIMWSKTSNETESIGAIIDLYHLHGLPAGALRVLSGMSGESVTHGVSAHFLFVLVA